MSRPQTYREVSRRLTEHDPRFAILTRRGKGSHRMIVHPDVAGRAESFPLKCHGEGTEIGVGTLKAIIRRFHLPRDFFD